MVNKDPPEKSPPEKVKSSPPEKEFVLIIDLIQHLFRRHPITKYYAARITKYGDKETGVGERIIEYLDSYGLIEINEKRPLWFRFKSDMNEDL